MWKKSKPNGYTSFRTFIFGITSQSMFPNGVIYEGVSEEPLSFRGESGANDSMVSSCIHTKKIHVSQMIDSHVRQPLADLNARDSSYRNLEGFPTVQAWKPPAVLGGSARQRPEVRRARVCKAGLGLGSPLLAGP